MSGFGQVATCFCLFRDSVMASITKMTWCPLDEQKSNIVATSCQLSSFTFSLQQHTRYQKNEGKVLVLMKNNWFQCLGRLFVKSLVAKYEKAGNVRELWLLQHPVISPVTGKGSNVFPHLSQSIDWNLTIKRHSIVRMKGFFHQVLYFPMIKNSQISKGVPHFRSKCYLETNFQNQTIWKDYFSRLPSEKAEILMR